MPKAILELEMPENCGECRLKCYDWTIGRYCTFTNKPLTTEYKEKRDVACPLKPVEDKDVWGNPELLKEGNV